ncbi:cytochrome P450 [Undibacterium sp. GrIS 1.2]
MKITEAAYAANPYPFYAELRARASFFHDESGLVVATDSRAARAILAEPAAAVRPLTEPVPKTIAGSTAGDVFGRLIRMTEGSSRDNMKRAMMEALATTTPALFREQAYRCSIKAIDAAEGRCDPMALAFSIPTEVMAQQLGFNPDQCTRIREQVALFTGCINPLSGLDAIAASVTAAKVLLVDTAALLADSTLGLARQIEMQMRRSGEIDDELLAANLIGMMSQTFDATAALTGQTLVALSRHRGRWDDREDDIALLDLVLRETLRHDSPIQNTRRFMAEDVVLGDGTQLRKGQTVLILLASANRDASSYADADRFDIDRQNLSSFSFSFGRHRCPGEEFARAMATGVVAAMRARGLKPQVHITNEPSYTISANARLPVLATVELAGSAHATTC